MTRLKWRNRIIKAMTKVGTYQDSFDDVIDTLAGMLERRDMLEATLDEDTPMMIEHTNKAGATNIEQNPAIRLLNDMNRDVRQYFNELGLTPKGLKAINDNVLTKEVESPFFASIEKAMRA